MKDTRFLEDLSRNATQYSALVKEIQPIHVRLDWTSDDDSIEFMERMESFRLGISYELLLEALKDVGDD